MTAWTVDQSVIESAVGMRLAELAFSIPWAFAEGPGVNICFDAFMTGASWKSGGLTFSMAAAMAQVTIMIVPGNELEGIINAAALELSTEFGPGMANNEPLRVQLLANAERLMLAHELKKDL